MTIAQIVVPMRDDGRGEGVMAHAIGIARLFSAHIETIYCRTQKEDLIPYGVAVPRVLREQIDRSIAAVSDGEEAHMRQVFEEISARSGIEILPRGEVPPRDRVSLTWHEEKGKQAEILAHFGRCADLVAVAQPDRSAGLGFNTLYAALMQTGRPVLMCPPGDGPESPLAHVAIAWNGSTEAARAVALGIDLVQKAEKVTVVTVGETPRGASVDELCGYLAARGIAAGREMLPAKGDIGAAILSACGRVGATMLLMGAYSHSRGREALLGGVSHHVVEHARLPACLVH